MLKHTQKIKEKYEEIQRRIFYMVPEKWEELYLYTSIIDRLGDIQTGEMFFYYIPKGLIKRKPVNVYEIPSRFNIDENDYLNLVNLLYDSLKELRELFKNTNQKVWTNLTISIKNFKFKIEYNYDSLSNRNYNSEERHLIWKYKYLNLNLYNFNKEEKEVIQRYLSERKDNTKNETYEAGIYIKDIKNIVDYETEDYESIQNVEYVASKRDNTRQNQILFKK